MKSHQNTFPNDCQHITSSEEDADSVENLFIGKNFEIHTQKDLIIDKDLVEILGTNINKAIQYITSPIKRCVFLIVNDAKMIELHSRWCGKKNTTDVLTFNEGSLYIEADIAICLDEAKRKLPNNMIKEMTLYSIHGLLHCSGYDDKTKYQSIEMHKEENRIGHAIGIDSLFDNSETTK